MDVVGYLAAGLGGAVLGWLLCAVFLSRNEPVSSSHKQEQAHLAAAVIARSGTGYLVTNADGDVLLTNARAQALGVVRAGMPDPRIAEAIGRAAVSDDLVDVELGAIELPPGLAGPAERTRQVHAVVQAIGDGLILVAGADESAAQRVEAVRRDFVANVSHELKTPVASIGLLAEAAMDAADDPDAVRHFTGKLHREVGRLGALVDELIALSRLQGAEPLAELAVVEVDAVVAEAISRTATIAEGAGVTVTADAPAGLLVRGDRTLLITAITNLIDNAINYSPSGAAVTVSRAVRDGAVEIAVTDRGIGIAPELQERVFERFFRADPARSRATGGTGLGLAIVKHVAANHGGTATVWSRPGTGSTFTVRIPRTHAGNGPAIGTAAPTAAVPNPAVPTAAVPKPAVPTPAVPTAAVPKPAAPTAFSPRGAA